MFTHKAPPLNSLNAQLRALFVDLDKPTPSLKFLYDMSAKISDSVFYATNNTADTLSADMWHSIYSEMFHAAYDTTTYTIPDTVFMHAHGYYSDTIPMGVMRYSYYKFKDEALHTGTYFDFDTINTILTEHYPSGSWPYLSNALFVAAPLIGSSDYTNPVFRIDPQFIFLDAAYYAFLIQNNWTLKIDFGDGLGWINFNINTITNHQVIYADGGKKLIKAAIFNVVGTLVDFSQSRLLILGDDPLIPPDETWTFIPGMTVGVYEGCNHIENSGRLIIYLEGFDIGDIFPFSNRTAADIYSKQIAPDPIIQLQNDGYNFLVVDWKRSGIDIRFNALYLLNFLEYLKGISTDDEQFVIVGRSIGGVIARYTPTFMEHQQYQSENYDAFFQDEYDENNIVYLLLHPYLDDLPTTVNHKEKMHNTRLLITDDSPHQGAILPLSIQHAYNGFFALISHYIGPFLTISATIFNFGINAQAAQQTFIYHVDTKSGSTYTARSEKNKFFTQLNSLGNYPKYAKVVAMSNGSLAGEPQTNIYTGEDRVAGDRLVDFSTELFARALWIKVPLFGADLECNTDFDGYGHIYAANAGRYTIALKLYWFGVKIETGYNSLFDVDEYATTKPYSTNAGGYFPPDLKLVGTHEFDNPNQLSQWWLFNVASWHTSNDGDGCFTIDSHIGWEGFASVNFDLSVCSDGSYFCHVPLQSALDYGTLGTTYPLNLNIETLSVNTNLNRVKADVIIGIPSGYPSLYPNNAHSYFRNDYIYNITQTAAPNDPFTYYTCIGVDDSVKRGFINLEIGDEELYLENNILPWTGKYQTEFNIRVNKRNPHYEYVGYTYPPLKLDGIYSKKAAFIIQSPGHAIFQYDKTGTPVIPAFQYGSPLSSDTTRVNEPLYICCTNYKTPIERLADLENEFTFTEEFKNILLAFPNPNNGKELILNYTLHSKGEVIINVLNTLGKIVYYKKEFALEDLNQSILNLSFLPQGMYVINISNNYKQANTQILIIK